MESEDLLTAEHQLFQPQNCGFAQISGENAVTKELI